MKKSKVIIPAMALLLFSTAASVTGTVAWFTSTRVFTATASQFKVGQTDGGLEASLSSGVGTTASATAGLTYNDKVTVDANTNLTHGSFNHAASEAWILNRNATSDGNYRVSKGTLSAAETAYADSSKRYNQAGVNSDPWFVKTVDDQHYYVAFSWTITFKYTWNTENKNVGIYLNRKASTMKFKSAADANNVNVQPTQEIGTADAASKTAYGFRIAFVTESTKKIWGNNNDASLHYATGADKESGVGTYEKTGANPNYFVSETGTYNAAEDGTSDTDTANKTRAERVCTLTFTSKIDNSGDNNPDNDADNGKSVLDVHCVAWYEGEDLNNVISTAEMDIVDVTMSFYARSDYSNS